MRPLSPVVWSEGMHLAPHHFQVHGRYLEECQHFALSALFPHGYGLAGLELDEEALRNGTVSVVHARGIMPDGLTFHFPHEPPPDPLHVRELFSPTAQSHRVLLAIPPYRPASANCAVEENGGAPDVRFTASPEEVADSVTGQEERVVSLARKNFRLLLEPEEGGDPSDGDVGDGEPADPAGGDVHGGLVTLPVARVRRDGAGNFVYDPEFVPPSLQVAASRGLMDALARLVDVLEARSRSLAAERGGEGHGSPGEVVRFWFTHAVNSHLPVLRQHLADGSAHPERLFADLSGLAGALATFSLAGDAAALPLYEHEAPGDAFRDLERAIRSHLDTVVASNVRTLPVEPRGDGHFHTIPVQDPRAVGTGAHWFLGVRSTLSRDELVSRVPRLVKLCSDKHIDRLVREAYPGLDLEHVTSPPAGLSPRPGYEYFRIGRTDPCWRSIVDTKAAGLYVPESVPEAELELVVILEDEPSTG